MRTKKRLLLTLPLLALLSAESMAQEYYTWRDDRGHLVMSDRPPEDPSVEFKHVEPPFGRRRDAPPNAAFRPREQEPDSTATPGRNELASREANRKEPDRERCAAARDRLFKLRTFPRMRTEDDDGVRFMTPQEISEQIDINETLEEKHCLD